MIKVAGFLLIIIGILMIAFNGFNFTTTEKVVDAGSLHITKDKNHPVQWSPIAGGVLIAGGIVVLVLGKKSST